AEDGIRYRNVTGVQTCALPISMVLGMGLPSIPAYIITATMAAPALAGFDIPILAAHMFVFYFGVFANITPPVCLAAFAGAGISGGDPMKTGFLSLKLALADRKSTRLNSS